jgi:hypothetical protein
MELSVIRGLIRAAIEGDLDSDRTYALLSVPMAPETFDFIYQQELRKIAAELNSRPGSLDT